MQDSAVDTEQFDDAEADGIRASGIPCGENAALHVLQERSDSQFWAFGAVQVGVDGQASAHTRGTPPNVVETDPRTWLALASGRMAWPDALAGHRVSASGVHADLTAHLAGLAAELGGGR